MLGVWVGFRRRVLFFLVLLLATASFTIQAEAHGKGFTYIYLNVGTDSLGGRFEILHETLVNRMPLDANDDGVIDKEEFSANAELVYEEFGEHLTFFVDGTAREIEITSHDFLDVPFGTFALVKFEVPGVTEIPDSIDIEHSDAFWDDPAHQVMLLIESNEKIGLFDNESYPTLIFEDGADRRSVSMLGEPRGEVFSRLLKQGIIQFAIGYDHVLFLLTLLLSAVLFLNSGQWAPAPGFREAFFNVLTVVVLFTIAHSLTLSLAALDIVRLPAALIEPLIALSIIAIAAANLLAWSPTGTRTAVFSLGLLHGFGFANVLAHLYVAQATLLTSLLAFNLGVEIGQVAIIVAVFPILFLLRNWRYYVPVILWGISAIAIVIATMWFIRRSLDVCGLLDGTALHSALCSVAP